MRELNCMYTNPPTSGKFVAFYDDGGGASLFVMKKPGSKLVFNTDDEPYVLEDLIESSYASWLPIPDSYKFWFERE